MGDVEHTVVFERGDDVVFIVPAERYTVEPADAGLGSGAFGAVCAAVSKRSGDRVAIKKSFNVFSKRAYKATVREIMLLDHFTHAGGRPHPNVVSLLDVFVPSGLSQSDMDDVYFVMPAYDCSLRSVLRDEALTALLNLPRRVSLFQQLLRGLKAIHDAGCLHRDIKPENVLIRGVSEKAGEMSPTPELAICDLGSGRDTNLFVTEDVLVTTWPYVAPEALAESPQNPWAMPKDARTMRENPAKVDIWAAGCILGEMLAGEQLFPEAKFGPPQAMAKQAKMLGVPPDVLMEKMDPKVRQKLVDVGTGKDLEKHLDENGLFQCEDNPDGATPVECALLSKILVYNPRERFNCDEALKDPYFADSKFGDVPDIPEFKRSEATDSGLEPDAARALVWDIMERYAKQ
eukprot:Hpha_TRINITY_DN16035_c2_g5::TRINITY_DN16035_c2_g5_i1::g.120377::m.120377/K04441/P38; p38 MAP kinase